MARQTAWFFAALLACGAPAGAIASIGAQGVNQPDQKPATPSKEQQERRKWWLHDRAELGITDPQSSQIDQIFSSTIPRLRALREEVEQLEGALSTAIKAHVADVATLGQQIDKVDKARAEYSKTHTLMLYRMHLVLNADQRAKLKALRDRREAERRKDNDRRR